MDLSDIELIEKIVGGEKLVRDYFIKEYSGFIFSIIYKSSFNMQEDDAQDIFQQIVTSLIEDDYRKLKQFKGNSSLKTWLAVMTKRKVIDYRKKWERDSIEVKNDPIGDDGDYGDRIVVNENIKLLRELIKTHLKAEEQIFIRMYFEKELSAGEISKILGMKEGTVYTRKNRVLEKIRKIYKKNYL